MQQQGVLGGGLKEPLLVQPGFAKYEKKCMRKKSWTWCTWPEENKRGAWESSPENEEEHDADGHDEDEDDEDKHDEHHHGDDHTWCSGDHPEHPMADGRAGCHQGSH